MLNFAGGKSGTVSTAARGVKKNILIFQFTEITEAGTSLCIRGLLIVTL
jgi:hypothetical protein